jgi:hypothetical protein
VRQEDFWAENVGFGDRSTVTFKKLLGPRSLWFRLVHEK